MTASEAPRNECAVHESEDTEEDHLARFVGRLKSVNTRHQDPVQHRKG